MSSLVHVKTVKTDPYRWTYLQAGISRVMNDLEQGIDMQMYMGVYTLVTFTTNNTSEASTDLSQRCP